MAADRFGFGLEVLDTFCSLHPGQATAQLWIANAGLPELLASFGSLLLLLSVLGARMKVDRKQKLRHGKAGSKN